MQEQLAKHDQSTPQPAPTIFVVDDDAAVLRSMTRLLGSVGWNAEAFASADALLERAPITGQGCVLLDVQMPGMSGLELHARMSAVGIFLPVVFLTGKGDIPMSVRAMKHGAVNFLVNPVEEEVLFQALEQAIRRQAAEAAARQNPDSIMGLRYHGCSPILSLLRSRVYIDTVAYPVDEKYVFASAKTFCPRKASCLLLNRLIRLRQRLTKQQGAGNQEKER